MAAIRRLRTTVGIVGAGPAGLVLANLLRLARVDCVVVDRHDRARLRTSAGADLIEHRTVDLLARHDLAAGLRTTGAVHGDCEFRAPGWSYVLDYGTRTGRPHRGYPQRKLAAELLEAFDAGGGRLLSGVQAVEVTEHEAGSRVDCVDTRTGGLVELSCDLVAGCDGRQGAVRRSLPAGAVTVTPVAHGVGWLGVRAATPTVTDRIVYAAHPDGFAGHGPDTPTTSTFSLQCAPDEHPGGWPPERIWKELTTRLGADVGGEIIDTAMFDVRSHVVAPMRYGRVFLAGDAAHVLGPAASKGLNLAVADAGTLAELIGDWVRTGDEAHLDRYSPARLADVWAAQAFSRGLLDLLQAYPAGTPHAEFQRELAGARLRGLATSPEQAAAFAAGYAGPPP